MRVIRLKFPPNVKEFLREEVLHKYPIDDVGFLEDLLALILNKGQGLPTDERVVQMAKTLAPKLGVREVMVTMLLRKRKQVLASLVKAPYFKVLLAVEPLDALEKIVLVFIELFRKVRQIQCETCQYFSLCKFGKEYADKTFDVRKVIDEDWQSKVHEDCPHYPDISFSNQVDQANRAMLKMMQANLGNSPQQKEEEVLNDPTAGMAATLGTPPNLSGSQVIIDDEDSNPDELDPEEAEENFVPSLISSFGKGAESAAEKFSASGYLDSMEKLSQSLSQRDLLIYELGAVFDFMLETARKNKKKDTDEVSKATETKAIDKLSDMSRAVSSELALPDDVFITKAVKGMLQKKQNKETTDKKHLMYVLIDISGSMTTQLAGKGALRVLTRREISKVILLALARRMLREKGILYLRFFDDAPGPLVKLESSLEYQDFIRKVSLQNFAGGGTNIQGVLATALKDIDAAKDILRKADILLITDCDDVVDEVAITSLLGKLPRNPLHTLDVAASSGNYRASIAWGTEAASVVLKKTSAKYYKVNPGEGVSLEKIVEIVT